MFPVFLKVHSAWNVLTDSVNWGSRGSLFSRADSCYVPARCLPSGRAGYLVARNVAPNVAALCLSLGSSSLKTLFRDGQVCHDCLGGS